MKVVKSVKSTLKTKKVKNIIVVFTLFLSFSALSKTFKHALSWTQLEIAEDYFLHQRLEFKHGKKFFSGSSFILDVNEKFRLNSSQVLNIPGFSVSLFSFEKTFCSEREMSVVTEMEIVSSSSFQEEGGQVGVQFENCFLFIYVESRDLVGPSLLTHEETTKF